MALSFFFVSRFEEVLGHAQAFLSREFDLFAKPRIVVPNAGAKAWLWSELAHSLGAGPSRRDGIVANVEISYPGTILSLLQPPRGREPDPWSFDRLTFTVLDVIASPEAESLELPFDVSREPLLAARRIAGLFDEYHVRRPGMILEWERPKPDRSMQPTANDEQRDGEPVAERLPDQDHWQFDLWRLVRQRIDRASPPARASVENRGPHEPLLVAGLQSLSWPQLQALQQLGMACEVEALLVHPSPGLRAVWETIDPSPLEPKLRGRPLRRNSRKSEAEAAETDAPVLPDGVDPLPGTWLSGARELQRLITSQGVAVAPLQHEPERRSTSLLQRMQATVMSGREPGPDQPPFDAAVDHSIAIHRCHSLSRQAEVLHDAILHAFNDPKLPGLQPHDVVIMSPCLEQAAPHLEAVFQRSVRGRDATGAEKSVNLPLVIADRGLLEASESIELLSQVLALPGSRCSVDDLLGIAAHPLVRPHFGIDDDTISSWQSLLERTQVRWGLDHVHREHHGLSIGDPDLRDVHTWKSGLEQMLLGVTLPDAVPKPELGGVVPLDDLDPADLPKISRLMGILDCLGRLARLATAARTVSVWCDAIEESLVSLCGEGCRQLAEPLALLRRLRDAGAGAETDHEVGFDEIRTLLAEWCGEKAGRQPLYTGAITATSMVPLRGVPFRVVCVMGYDDEAIGMPEPSKDDLVAKMPLVGDVDPRAEQRRALLDSLTAAKDRLVITCTGRDVKTNEIVPLVTPLAELAECAVRHGVTREKATGPSQIEIDHPRHHLGRRNFIAGAVQSGVTWSHDWVACEVAASAVISESKSRSERRHAMSAPPVGPAQSTSEIAAQAKTPQKREIDVSWLENCVRDPLGLFLEETLGIRTWRDDAAATPATLPLELEDRAARKLTEELIQLLSTGSASAVAWGGALRQSGRLPLGPHGDMQAREIIQLAEGIVAKAAKEEIPLTGLANPVLRIELPTCRIVGRLEGFSESSRQLVTHTAKKVDRGSWARPLQVSALRLLIAAAIGLRPTEAVVVSRNPKWCPGAEPSPCQIRTVMVAEEVDIIDRLSLLCDLTIEALEAPRGLFGLHEVAPDSREEEFESFLRARNWHTGELSYPRSPEAIVYGRTPAFASIFASGSHELAFLERYQACVRLNGRKGSSKYTLV